MKLRIDGLFATPHGRIRGALLVAKMWLFIAGRKLHGHLGQTGKVLASTTQKAKNALSSFFGGGGNFSGVEPAAEAQ